ncbi:uncharacterized protein [Nicotiana sylvestris]|uniref:uncharacterized protein n=1 Tax=Nicotiana sylvestris TaxID=4096 RepID=UPI00388CCAB2
MLKDYDITIFYNPEKANMVADALCKKAESMGSLYILIGKRPLALDVQALGNLLMRLDASEPRPVLACMVSRSLCMSASESVNTGSNCVPNVDVLHEMILEEAHSLRYSIHSGAAKMYQDLRKHY